MGAVSKRLIPSSKARWKLAIVFDERELNAPIDVEAGPLARLVYLSDNPDASRTVLILTFHHAVIDGASGAHLVDDNERQLVIDSAARLDATVWQNRDEVTTEDDLFRAWNQEAVDRVAAAFEVAT